MAALISRLLLMMAPSCMLLDGSVRTPKIVRTPYGPKMCEELCKGLMDSFTFEKVQLACHCLSRNDSSRFNHTTEDSSILPSRHSEEHSSESKTGKTPAICDSDSQDASAEAISKPLSEMTAGHALHKSCEEGKLCVVKYILTRRLADINCRGKKGRTPVMVAARNGQVAVLEYLLKQGCVLSLFDADNNSVIHMAAIVGNVDTVKALVASKKVDIECKGWMQMTPVLFAAFYGKEAEFDFLVSKGCNLTVVDSRKTNILHAACTSGNVHIVKYILLHDIVNIESRVNHLTPLMIAAEHGHKQIVDLLVNKGCNLSAVDINMNNVLHRICANTNVDMVRHIVSKEKSLIDSRGFAERTPAMLAVRMGKVKVLAFLISRGCNTTLRDINRDSLIHVACIYGQVNMVNYILSKRIDGIENKDVHGLTPVMLAAQMGQVKVVNFLISKGCNLTDVDNRGFTLLHVACVSGKVDMVENIVSRNILDFDSVGFAGRTPIMLAAQLGYKDVFVYLATSGCNITTLDVNSNDVLHHACSCGYVDIVTYILSTGVMSLESRGFSGMSAVMMAAKKGDKRVFDLLVNEGCSLEVLDVHRNNILHCACMGGNIDIVKYILKKGTVSINSRNMYGRTPLLHATEYGHKKVFNLLLRKRADVSELDDEKNNVLHVACSGGKIDMVKYVLAKFQFGLESVNSLGRTPMLAAAKEGQTVLVDFLLGKGSNLTVVDNFNNNALHLACISGEVDTVNYILTKGTSDIESRGYRGCTPVMLAALEGQVDVVVFLMGKGSKLTSLCANNNNILHLASFGGHVDMVKFILAKRIVDVANRGMSGLTPIMTAAKMGHRGVFQLLVNEGCNLTVLDNHRNNLLHVACTGGDANIVEYILKKGVVDINSRGSLGRTPVMIAAVHGHTKVFHLLTHRGCDLKAVDGRSYNVLHAACLGGNLEIVKYLIELGRFDVTEKTRGGKTPVQIARRKGHFKIVVFLRSAQKPKHIMLHAGQAAKATVPI